MFLILHTLIYVLQKLIVSAIYGYISGVGFMCLIADYVDSIYTRKLANGEDLNVGSIEVYLYLPSIGVGICVFLLGLFGKLPGTK